MNKKEDNSFSVKNGSQNTLYKIFGIIGTCSVIITSLYGFYDIVEEWPSWGFYVIVAVLFFVAFVLFLNFLGHKLEFNEYLTKLKNDDFNVQKKDVKSKGINEISDLSNLKIGSYYSGGIVFYLDESGEHGLVCAYDDFEPIVWGTRVETEAKGNGIADGSGESNTNLIISCKADLSIPQVFPQWAIDKNPSAARLCSEANNNGYNDWYLPTLNELREMTVLYNMEIGNLKKSKFYWSSIEYDSIDAWVWYFLDNESDWEDKSNIGLVRAVRRF